MELVFLSINDSTECVDGNSDINILAIAIVVPIAVLALIVIVVVITVPSLRAKVFPFSKRQNVRVTSY